MPAHRTTRWTRLSSRTTRSLTLAAAAAGAFGVPALASAATAAPAPAVAPVAVSAAAPAAAIQAALAAAPSAQHAALGAPAAGHANTLTVAPSASTPAPKTYHVVKGDTLFGIAQSTLGSGDRYHEIFDANQGKAQAKGGSLTNPDLILPGWDLQIPNGSAKAAPSSTTHTTQGTAKKSSTVSKPATQSAAKASTTTAKASSTSYPDNLDGWIREAQAILAANGYKVSYNAIYQTVMHESGGNPKAVNGWDSNAAAGHPSIGLMQTIQPTFNAYALPGHTNIYNPVDNIIAGARYAAARYGSLDNVVAARCGGSCWFGY